MEYSVGDQMAQKSSIYQGFLDSAANDTNRHQAQRPWKKTTRAKAYLEEDS
jgi:hypothetical protein